MDKIPIPETQEELKEMLHDRKRVADLIETGQFTDVIEAYAKATDKRGDLSEMVGEHVRAAIAGDEAIKETINSSVGDTMTRFFSEHGVVQRPPLATPGDTPSGAERNAAYNALAPGAAMNDLGFVNLGDFAKTIWHKNPLPDQERLNKVRQVMNAYSSVDPAAGGFLIPETMRAEILQIALETAIVRPRATVVTMSSLSQLFPYVDSTTHVGSVFGGMVFYWVGESTTLTATEAKFGRLRLEANKLTGLAAVPNELWADAPALSSFLMQAIPRGLAFYEDVAFVSGSGVGEPLGFLNSAALIPVSAEAGQLADTIQIENVLNMYARMLPSSLSNAVWIANPTTFKELMTMSISVGVGGATISLVDIRTAPFATMLGRPLIMSEKVPVLGDQGDLNFVDLSYYLIGDRQAVSMETSEHVYFASDETALRVIERVDGRPWVQSAFQPTLGDTVSPFVAIEARA